MFWNCIVCTIFTLFFSVLLFFFTFQFQFLLVTFPPVCVYFFFLEFLSTCILFSLYLLHSFNTEVSHQLTRAAVYAYSLVWKRTRHMSADLQQFFFFGNKQPQTVEPIYNEVKTSAINYRYISSSLYIDPSIKRCT